MTHDDMIAVIQAAKLGETIQSRRLECNVAEWTDDPTPTFSFGYREYRVKKREPREWWMIAHLKHCTAGNQIDGKYGWHVYDQRQPAEFGPTIHVREVLE